MTLDRSNVFSIGSGTMYNLRIYSKHYIRKKLNVNEHNEIQRKKFKKKIFINFSEAV